MLIAYLVFDQGNKSILPPISKTYPLPHYHPYLPLPSVSGTPAPSNSPTTQSYPPSLSISTISNPNLLYPTPSISRYAEGGPSTPSIIPHWFGAINSFLKAIFHSKILKPKINQVFSYKCLLYGIVVIINVKYKKNSEPTSCHFEQSEKSFNQTDYSIDAQNFKFQNMRWIWSIETPQGKIFENHITYQAFRMLIEFWVYIWILYFLVKEKQICDLQVKIMYLLGRNCGLPYTLQNFKNFKNCCNNFVMSSLLCYMIYIFILCRLTLIILLGEKQSFPKTVLQKIVFSSF